MKTHKILPKRVFNSPLLMYVNFKDGSILNLIRLNKPYANGQAFAIYETTNNPIHSSGLFKSLDAAKKSFELIEQNEEKTNRIIGRGIINK